MRRGVRSIVPFVSVLLLAACTDMQQPTAPGDARREELEAPVAAGRLGDPLPGLTDAQLMAFARGKVVFNRQFTQAAGLGPTFNANSCLECHGEVGGVPGGTGDEIEFHFTRLNADGSCSKLASHGGSVRQNFATGRLMAVTDFVNEPFPTVAHDTAERITPDLFGFGLVAAIPADSLQALADPNDANGDGISGRAHMVAGVLGRFGRKAAGTDLDGFNAGAFLNEIGITNPLAMEENSVGRWVIGGDSIPANVDPIPEPELGSADLADLNAFVRFLAPPPSTAPNTAEELWGEALFDSIGCDGCHTAKEFTTVSSIAALNGKKVRPFSDFLLHDMGPQPQPSDICLVNAGKTEFRTEPLMGARFMELFIHDGRAANLGQAIFQHGGEAAAARAAYTNLDGARRLALLAYIKTL